mgnify:CR=1 FL=1
MSDVCFRIQDLLAAEGPAALQDHELEQQHVSDCSECLAYLEALTEIDQDQPIQNSMMQVMSWLVMCLARLCRMKCRSGKNRESMLLS